MALTGQVADVPISDLSLIEERIVRLILAGRGIAEIAEELGTDRRLVIWHIDRAMGKLGKARAVHSRLRRALSAEPSLVRPDTQAHVADRRAP